MPLSTNNVRKIQQSPEGDRLVQYDYARLLRPSSSETSAVTGCSTGIGKWLSSTAYEAGHFVVATSRDTSKLTHLPSDVPAVLKLQLDVNSPVSISKCIEATLDHFGCIDVLVNNAGYGLFGDTEGVHDHLAREAFETNFWGPVSLTKEMVRVFRDVNPKGRGGAVIQISSFGGWIGYPGGAFYYAR